MLLFAALSLSSANPPVDTVVLYPNPKGAVDGLHLWTTLNAYIDADGQVVMGSSITTWTATRSEIVADVAPDGLYFDLSVGYRRDRLEGPNDTVIGERDGLLADLLDPTQPPYIQGHWPGQRAFDVDGDGTVDLLESSGDGVILMSWAGVRAVPLPPSILDLQHWPAPSPKPAPDLDGDGHAELIAVETLSALPFTSNLHLFDGHADGYDEVARFTLPLDGTPLDVVALQADDDPELELLVLLVDYYAYFYSTEAVDVRTVLVDDAGTASPSVSVNPGTWPVWDHAYLGSGTVVTPLRVLGDLDGDGRDEALLTGRMGPAGFIDLHILGSARSYDVANPLRSLGLQSNSDVAVLPLNIDLDGHLDLAAVSVSWPAYSFIQVWFGPFVDPYEPPDTGLPQDTGLPEDTGLPDDTGPTQPTGATTHTGTPPDDTGPTDPGDPAPAATPAPSCGCQAPGGQAPWLLLTLAGLTRRRRAP